MNAFVTDGNQRPALAITRSLGRRGISVIVGESAASSLASSSRYASRHVTYPSPEHEPKAFQRFLLNFVRREHVDVIVPVTDVTTHLVTANQEALHHYSALAAPPFEAFEAITNKWTLLDRAARCGVPVAGTTLVEGIARLNERLVSVRYPVVVKSTHSRLLTDRGWMSTTVQYAGSEAQLKRIYETTGYLRSHPSLIQERIDGAGVAIFALFDRGRPLTAFAHRRLREKPPSGGVSVLCESAAVDPQLHDFANRVLSSVGWHGVAMMEFKKERRTGTCFLMEVNGRFWGSLQLAIDAGVDFPYLSYQLALGHQPAVPATYRVGVKSRWLLGDLDHLLIRLTSRNGDLHLSDSASSRLAALIEFLKFVQPDLSYDTISASDPRPFVHELLSYARGNVSAAARAMRRRFSHTTRPTLDEATTC